MDTKLSAQFLAQQEKKLKEMKMEMKNQIEKLQKDDPFSDPDYASDNAAVDTDVREQDYHAIVEAQIKQLQKRLTDVDYILTKISKGKYGYCERCGKDIPKARLELIPEARYCVECETKLRK